MLLYEFEKYQCEYVPQSLIPNLIQRIKGLFLSNSEYDLIQTDKPDIYAKHPELGELKIYFKDHDQTKHILHREDGPALVVFNCHFWFVDGLLHRDNGPAIEYKGSDGTLLEYYQKGERHRIDGPARIYKFTSVKEFKEKEDHSLENKSSDDFTNYFEWRHKQLSILKFKIGNVTEYYQYDKLHRQDGPARIFPDCEEYYDQGKLFKVVNTKTLLIKYCKDGLLHREGGPAYVNGSTQIWFLNGLLHREGGPAMETSKYKAWYRKGQFSNPDGPHMETKKGYKAWFVGGVLYHSDPEFIYSNPPVINPSVISRGLFDLFWWPILISQFIQDVGWLKKIGDDPRNDNILRFQLLHPFGEEFSDTTTDKSTGQIDRTFPVIQQTNNKITICLTDNWNLLKLKAGRNFTITNIENIKLIRINLVQYEPVWSYRITDDQLITDGPTIPIMPEFKNQVYTSKYHCEHDLVISLLSRYNHKPVKCCLEYDPANEPEDLNKVIPLNDGRKIIFNGLTAFVEKK